MSFLQRSLAGALAALICLGCSPASASVLLQLRVTEGEGAVYGIGSRATRGLTVQVTDETGKPVEGASVSFRLPDSGPGGTFSAGLRSEVVTTRADGKAAVWGMQWNKIPGPFEIRITAIKDQARAGIVSSQYLSDSMAAAKSGGAGNFQASHHFSKWLIIGAAVAAGAAAGVVFGQVHASSATTATVPTVPTQIGLPSITIGAPH